MIVTLTVNPSLDRTITLERALQPGEVQSALSSREDAAGKGINVARSIAAAGAATRAVLPLAIDDPYRAILRASALPVSEVPIVGHSRANITIADPAGITTKLNLPGPALSPSDARAIIAAVVEASAGASWLVLAGSLPPGVGDDFYVVVINAVRAAHGESSPLIAVDTSGVALRTVVEHGAPDLIKPNDEELAELVGIELADDDSIDAVIAVARQLVPARAASALVTLGSRGAVLVTGESALVGEAPRIRVASTVGAGDSSLAGYVLAHAQGLAPDDCVRSAIRYGAAAASLPGTQAPTPADLPAGDVFVTTHS